MWIRNNNKKSGLTKSRNRIKKRNEKKCVSLSARTYIYTHFAIRNGEKNYFGLSDPVLYVYTRLCVCIHKKNNINNKILTSMVIDFFSPNFCANVYVRYTHNKFGTVSMILLFLMFIFFFLCFSLLLAFEFFSVLFFRSFQSIVFHWLAYFGQARGGSFVHLQW